MSEKADLHIRLELVWGFALARGGLLREVMSINE